MVSGPVTVKPSTSMEEVAPLLIERRTGGVPVVYEEARLLGIVTEADLFFKRERRPVFPS